MPSPRSRRVPTRSQAPAPEPEPEAEAEPTDALEVEEPAPTDAVPADEPAPSSSSSRRGASGKRPPSARSRTASGRGTSASGRQSSRRQLTPEQRAAKSRAVKTVFGIIFGVILLGAAGYGVWWKFIRIDERQVAARNALVGGQAKIAAIEKALLARQADAADEDYKAALKELEIPELGYSKGTPNETDPQFTGMVNFAAGKKLRDQLTDDIKPRIEKSKRGMAVERNVADLESRFGKLTELDDGALAALEKDAAKFIENPVEPEASASPEYAKEYGTAVSGIKARLADIRQETARRRERMTSEPERLAHAQANTLIEQEKFKDALAMIDDMQRKYKDADFSKVRAMVEGAAKATWDSALKFAQTNYTTSQSPGSDTAQRQQALESAKRRMHEVVDRFGLDEYVQKAQAELATYGN